MSDFLFLLVDKSPYLAAAVICFGGFLWGMKIVFDWITGTNDAMRVGIVAEITKIKSIVERIQEDNIQLQHNCERLFMEHDDLKEHLEDVLKEIKDLNRLHHTIMQTLVLINDRVGNRSGRNE